MRRLTIEITDIQMFCLKKLANGKPIAPIIRELIQKEIDVLTKEVISKHPHLNK